TKEFNNVRKVLQDEGVNIELAEISWIPNTFIELDETKGKSVVSLMEKLENQDDVQNVYANFTLPKDLLAKL
ncbi:MAG: YebC/PmpR family DNA-binding transcriptional regulator, partial [Candidatus Scalindua sp.]|nr:YebC/PmpR family DNA-binding transcriptional regulator [Candidatus Scalindua sp.]